MHIQLIRGVTVIDGTGRAPASDQAVILKDDRIVAVGPATSLAASDAEVIDGRGQTLLPGLINMHAHLCHSGAPGSRNLPREPDDVQLLRAARNAMVSLACGVTTVRDVGCTGRIGQTVRDAFARGVLIGPRIVSCGRIITTSARHGWKTGLRADNAEEMKKAVRTAVEDGVDAIKIAASGGGGTPGSNVGAAQYSVDELRVAVDEARRFGKRVAVHAIATDSIRNAVQAGVDTIEHCGWMGPDGRLEVLDDVISAMLSQGITV
ncbi:MAG: amidohydrolase family protein, partial [bacterium]